MMKKQTLNDAGINVDAGVARIGGNAVLYEKLLPKFLEDPHFEQFLTFFEQGDIVAADQAIHAVKGVAGNLSILPLYELASEIHRKLSHNETDIDLLVDDIKKAYGIVREAIEG